jgi:pentatricopeptide repeat protein
VTSGHYTPDEGLLVKVMHVAARTGKPDLATRALDVLPILAVQPQEYHLVAMMEAYVNAGQVPQALQVLSTFRTVGLVPTSATAAPILAVLTSPELVDQAFFALEDFASQGQSVDITAFNVVLEAASRLNDLQRVRATQLAAADLGVVPDIDTYNSALSVCASSSHRELGDTILKEMNEDGISPNGATYHHLILLCATQPLYDDAFYYLEKSKAEGFKPREEAYRSLAIKCESERDPRYKLVVDELVSLGYKLEKPRETGKPRQGTQDRKPRDNRPPLQFRSVVE